MRTIGVVGVKCGMTRIFDPVQGHSIPVSVIAVKPNPVVQIKTLEHDGYDAIQVAIGEGRLSRLSKPLAGHYAKAEVVPGAGLFEFRLTPQTVGTLQVGAVLGVEQFSEGQKVDVEGVSKGRGFSGTVRRWNFKTQPASHGNSLSHRAPGSIGQNQTPGRVFKGKKMAGQYGNTQCTIQTLKVVQVDLERQVLLVKGAIPGAPSGRVIVYPAVKVKQKTPSTAVA
jgi:large subunit ribosomal protein L3